jgi:hypothetical protein
MAAGNWPRKAPGRIVDRHADHRRSVFVAGASKNSTSLVCDALNYDRRYRYLFEPFSDVSSVSTGLQQRLLWREYVSPDERSSGLRRYAGRIITGEARSPDMDRWTAPGHYDRRLISESRLNLWLKWLRVNFKGMPIVLVMRHPCAAVSSRLLLERPTRLNHVLQSEEFVSRYLGPFKSTVRAAKSPLERHALMWAIEHYVPLHEFAGEGLHVVSYERFVAAPQAELERLCTYLDERKTPDVSRLGIDFQQCAYVLNAWRTQLSPNEARRIMEIVAAFGLDRYYSIEAQPGPKAEQVLRNNAPRTDETSGVPLSGQQVGAIAQELHENLRRFERYIRTLGLRLYKINDGDQWQMHDWDWLWPKHEPFQLIEVAWADVSAMEPQLDRSVRIAIEAAYDIFRTMPPPLGHWATNWDGDINTFLSYMQRNLQACLRAASAGVGIAGEHLLSHTTG